MDYSLFLAMGATEVAKYLTVLDISRTTVFLQKSGSLFYYGCIRSHRISERFCDINEQVTVSYTTAPLLVKLTLRYWVLSYWVFVFVLKESSSLMLQQYDRLPRRPALQEPIPHVGCFPPELSSQGAWQCYLDPTTALSLPRQFDGGLGEQLRWETNTLHFLSASIPLRYSVCRYTVLCINREEALSSLSLKKALSCVTKQITSNNKGKNKIKKPLQRKLLRSLCF